MKKIFLYLIIMILFVVQVSAFTTELQDSQIRPTETLVLDITTTTNPERGDQYITEWYDADGNLLDTDVGSLSTTVGGVVNEIYVTISTQNITNGYVNTTVGGTTLQSFFNVTGNPGNAIIFDNAFFSPEVRVGSIFAVDVELQDVNGNELNNAVCDVFGTDGNDAPLQKCGDGLISYNGRVTCSGVLDNSLNENNAYLAKIRCDCGIGDKACYDKEGNTYEKYTGEGIFLFTISEWLNVNTITDMSEYESTQVIRVCANVTNSNYDRRLPLDIYYQIRCGIDNDDTDRVVIGANLNSEPDKRGISSNTTQNQCLGLIIPEKRWLQGRTNQCYASTDVWVLNEKNQRIKGYFTTSDTFSITINDLNINPDWSISGNNKEILTTIVNLSDSKYSDYQGIGSGNIDLRLNMETPEFTDAYHDATRDGIILFDNNFKVQNIESYSATYCDGTPIETELEILNDGNIEVELRNVSDLDNDCIIATVVMETYQERDVVAKEGFWTALVSWLGWMSPK